MPLVIVPAAGYGKRVGSPAAKELLADVTGQPLIAHSLDLAARRGWPCLVITREDKTELLQYLRARRQPRLHVRTIVPSREWPDTILQSQDDWRDRNIIVLPDTRWEPENTIDPLIENLDKTDLVCGGFETADYSTWGVINSDGWGCEKPELAHTELKMMNVRAWGLLGFQKSIGKVLFETLLKSTLTKQPYQLPWGPKILELTSFQDLTRG